MAGVRTGERKLKFDTSARYKQIASYSLTVNTPNHYFSTEKPLNNLLTIKIATA